MIKPARETIGSLRIHIEIDEIKPKIWRELVTPADITLVQFHLILQIAMGWRNSHLFSFKKDKQSWELPDEDFPEPLFDDVPTPKDVRKTALLEVLSAKGDKLTYTYDFGDNWQHTVKVMEASKDIIPYPMVLKAKRNCSPEDCGGPYFYEDFLEALRDPTHEEHEELSNWAEAFDPEGFDIEDTNDILEELPKENYHKDFFDEM